MADDSLNPLDRDKPEPPPKLLTFSDVAFWEKIYNSMVERGDGGAAACSAADRAVARRQQRLSPNLLENVLRDKRLVT